MANSSQLNRGFLFLYDWYPVLETLPAKELKKLLLALVAYQRDQTPLPLFHNPLTASYAAIIAPCIKRRIEGQRAALSHMAATEGEDEAPHEGRVMGGCP